MRQLALVALILTFVSGCSFGSFAFWSRDAARALADADSYAAHGDYPAAMTAYDSYLRRYPEDDGVDRARAMRAIVRELLAVRAERDRLAARETEITRQANESAKQAGEAARQSAELAKQAAAQAAAREAELAKLRQEMVTRQAEFTRLKEDLDALKRTDLQMERRRR